MSDLPAALIDRPRIAAEHAVDVVLDVGANEGNFARALREGGYRGRIVSFEPLSAAFEKLEHASAGDPMWSCHQLALGARSGRAELNVAANWASSSLLAMDKAIPKIEPRVRYVGTETCEVASLDELRAELLADTERLYLKLDVQGYELAVLEGAASTLAQVAVLDVELALVRLYHGAPRKDAVVSYLSDAGFDLVAIEDAWAPRGKVLEQNGLFVRRA